MATTMEKRVEIARNGRQPQEITELILDSIEASQIAGIDDTYCNMKTLGLANAGLTSLVGFPKLSSLDKLDLKGNKLEDGLHYLQGCTQLSQLDLSDNKIANLAGFEPLKCLEKLTHLDVTGNPVCETSNYRDKLFKLIPSLVFLNKTDSDGKADKQAEAKTAENSVNGKHANHMDSSKNESVGDDNEDDDDEDDDDEEQESGDDAKRRKSLGLSAIYDSNLGDLEDEDEDDYEEDDDDDDDDEEDSDSEDLDTDDDEEEEDGEDDQEPDDGQPETKKKKTSP